MTSNFRLGVVMLNTGFPRLPGDIGNPESFDFPVNYHRVEQASVAVVTAGDPQSEELVAAIEAAALALQGGGADLIVTSCGFLGGLQERIAARLDVPLLTSSLLLLPLLRAIHGSRRPLGILTFDSRRLSPHHFPAPVEGPLEIVGLEEGRELHRVIDGDLPELNPAAAEADALQALDRLLLRAPDCAAVVLECTNLSPYRPALAGHGGLPVYDLNTAIGWIAREKGFYSGATGS